MSYLNRFEDIKMQYPTLVDIILLLNQGYQQREIAHRLNIKASSVRNRIYHAKKRYGCKTTNELIEKYFTTHERK